MASTVSVKLKRELCDRARALMEREGYSSLEEFIEHAMERELTRAEKPAEKEDMLRHLKGLGYLE